MSGEDDLRVTEVLRDLSESFWDVAAWLRDGNWTPGNVDVADRRRIVTALLATPAEPARESDGVGLREAERDAGRVRLTDAENGWITNVWNGRGGRLAEAKRDLEAILRDRLAFPREAERSYLSLEWERVAKAATKRAEAAEAEVARLRAESAAQAQVSRDLEIERNMLRAALRDVLARAEATESARDAAGRVIEQVRALADEAESNPSARYIHPSRLRVALATADADATEGETVPLTCTCPPKFALSGGRHHTFCPLSTAKES